MSIGRGLGCLGGAAKLLKTLVGCNIQGKSSMNWKPVFISQ